MGIPRDPSLPQESSVGTWQVEIKPPALMTKTKLVNSRTIIKSPSRARTAVAKESKPASAQKDNKPSLPTAEEATADKSKKGSLTKSVSLKSTKSPSPTTSKE